MKNLDEIKKLLNNANEIYSLFNQKIPLWESRPDHYDKVGWGFNDDKRFSASESVPVYFSAYKGVYGDSGCSTQVNLDNKLFYEGLITYLNKNKKEIMLEIAKFLELKAKKLKKDAENELKSELEKLSKLDDLQV